MKQVIMESPLRGNHEDNLVFARNVCRSLTLEGYNPFASHVYYTQFLDEFDEKERNLGMRLGYEWHELCRVVFFCVREREEFEKSEGMKKALSHYQMLGKITVLRYYTQEGLFKREEEL